MVDIWQWEASCALYAGQQSHGHEFLAGFSLDSHADRDFRVSDTRHDKMTPNPLVGTQSTVMAPRLHDVTGIKTAFAFSEPTQQPAWENSPVAWTPSAWLQDSCLVGDSLSGSDLSELVQTYNVGNLDFASSMASDSGPPSPTFTVATELEQSLVGLQIFSLVPHNLTGLSWMT